MKFCFVLLFLPLGISAQIKSDKIIAQIISSESYVLVRSAPQDTALIMDTLYAGDLIFHLPNDTSDWWEVGRFKRWSSGFIPKSYIENLKTISRSRQRELLLRLFAREEALNRVDYYQQTTKERKRTREFHEDWYNPVLELFEFYQCQQLDQELFKQFLHILMLEQSSVDEVPARALTSVFFCHPEAVIDEALIYNHPHIRAQFEFGLEESSYLWKSQWPARFQELRDQLDRLYPEEP